MARFDDVFADLEAKMAAAIAVISQDPEMALAVKNAILGAQAQAVIEAENRADDARANVLATMVSDVAVALEQAAPTPPVEPEPEPEE